jgi:hypothetical protein
MGRLMRDSRLNGAERALQQSFSKFSLFNGLLMMTAVLTAFAPIRALPDRRARPPATVPLTYHSVAMTPVDGPLGLAGAWVMEANDRRLGGMSALAIDGGQFLAVSDRGAVARFDPPSVARPNISIQDLSDGPGPTGKKWGRDAESLARDPHGRGWWVGYEQHHSLWLYDEEFNRAEAAVGLPKLGWRDNRGAEGLIVHDGALLVLAENGRNAVRIATGKPQVLSLHAGAEIADAARAPDGSAWVLLREKGWGGISQSIASLRKTHDGYLVDPMWQLPKGPFDNYEGMAITSLPDGSWRFWLVTDDGHRFMARTLLVALDLALPVRPRHDKSPAKEERRAFEETDRRNALGGFRLRLLGQLALELGGAGRELFRAGLDQPIVEPADMLDRAQAVRRNAQLDALFERFRDQRDILQVGQERPLGLVVGVGNIVAHLPALAGQLANARHRSHPSLK